MEASVNEASPNPSLCRELKLICGDRKRLPGGESKLS